MIYYLLVNQNGTVPLPKQLVPCTHVLNSALGEVTLTPGTSVKVEVEADGALSITYQDFSVRYS